MVYAKGIFSLWGFSISSFRATAYLIDKADMQKIHVLLSQDLYVPSVKTTTYVCSEFNTYFCTEDHKTH